MTVGPPHQSRSPAPTARARGKEEGLYMSDESSPAPGAPATFAPAAGIGDAFGAWPLLWCVFSLARPWAPTTSHAGVHRLHVAGGRLRAPGHLEHHRPRRPGDAAHQDGWLGAAGRRPHRLVPRLGAGGQRAHAGRQGTADLAVSLLERVDTDDGGDPAGRPGAHRLSPPAAGVEGPARPAGAGRAGSPPHSRSSSKPPSGRRRTTTAGPPRSGAARLRRSSSQATLATTNATIGRTTTSTR